MNHEKKKKKKKRLYTWNRKLNVTKTDESQGRKHQSF